MSSATEPSRAEIVGRMRELTPPHVAVGGYIVFDDVTGWPGPTRLVTELPRWHVFQTAAPNPLCMRKTGE